MAAETQATKMARLDENVKSIREEQKTQTRKLDDFIKEQRDRDNESSLILTGKISDLDNRYVTKIEFSPYKRAIIIVGTVFLTAFAGALAALVIKGGI